MLNSLIFTFSNNNNKLVYFLLSFIQKFYNSSRLKDIKTAVNEVRKYGHLKVNGYFSEEEIIFYKKEIRRIACNKELKSDDEVKEGNLKIKHLQNYSSAITKLTQHLYFLLVSFVFYGRLRFPNALYTYTQDGTFDDGIVEGKCVEQISGRPHFDNYKDYLKILILLEDINEFNGPTHLIENSSQSKTLKKSYINFMNKNYDEAILTNDILNDINKNFKTVKLTGKKGDIIFINTKNIHWAGQFISGKREILWLYF